MADSGEIPDTKGVNWNIVDHALRRGRGGLATGSSLSRLLAEERSAVQTLSHISLSEGEILDWADGFYTRTGRWPNQHSGDLAEIDGIS